MQGKFVENVPGWEDAYDTDSGKSHSIKNHRMNNSLPGNINLSPDVLSIPGRIIRMLVIGKYLSYNVISASTVVSNVMKGNGLHTEDSSGFRIGILDFNIAIERD